MQVNANQILVTSAPEIPNPVTHSLIECMIANNMNPVQIGPCNHTMDSNSTQLPTNMNATLNKNPLTPDRQVCGGSNGIDNVEYYTVVEYSDKCKFESEKELCDSINKIKNNFTRETRKKGVAVRFKIGQIILHYYKGEYGQNEMKRIAKNTCITLSALYKYVQLAKQFSETQIRWFMDIEYISYRLVSACLSIDDEAEIRQVFMTSTNAKEAENKIRKLKQKESAINVPNDNVSDSIDHDNKTAMDAMDNTDLAHKNTDKETSKDSNVAEITEIAKEQLPKGSRLPGQQATEKNLETEQNKCQQDGQSSQANETETNINASQAEESQVTNGEHGKPATEKRTPSADTDGNQQQETQDGEAESPSEQKKQEQIKAAPQQDQEDAGVGGDSQKGQDFSDDDSENDTDSGADEEVADAADEEADSDDADEDAEKDDADADADDDSDADAADEAAGKGDADSDSGAAEKADSGAENAQDKVIDKDVKDIASENFSLPNFQLSYNQGGVQGLFPPIYEKTGIIGNVLIKASQEMPDYEHLREVFRTAIAEISALLSLVSKANTSHFGTTTLSEDFEWASSCPSVAAGV